MCILRDTTTVKEPLSFAAVAVAEQVARAAYLHPEAAPKVNVDGIEELVSDKGHHNGAVLAEIKTKEVRTHIPEKKQAGKRHSKDKEKERQAIHQNLQRVRGKYGQEFVETTRRTRGTKFRALL